MRRSKPTAVSGPVSWGQYYPKAILVIAALTCLLPFANKAFNIDDPLFVWAGRQMQTRWWDPYGFQVNWYGSPMPMHEVTKNPPLACAGIALIISVFGENEFPLHAVFLLQAIAVVLGTHALARRLCDHPLHAALAALFTPVFMVSSTTVMCDVLMVALWVWAVVLWMRGLENNHPLSLVLAALLVGVCSLAKYFGIALIPLLLVYSLMRNGRPGWWLVYFLIPLAIIGLYEGAMRSLYGHGLMWEAFIYANKTEVHKTGAILFKVLTALSFTGGCCAIVLIFAPVLWRPRFWMGAAIVAIFLLPTTWILLGSLPVSAGNPARLGVTLLWTLFILGGLSVLTLPILEWKHHRNAEILMLLLWVWGTFVFCILNWTINGRSVLPMVPAVAILLLRRIEFVRKPTKLRLNWFFGAAAVLSLLVSFADYRLANSARAAVAEFQTKFGDSSSTVWFQGHWGFQYYAQANGLHTFDRMDPQTRSGDLMIVPGLNPNVKRISKDALKRFAIIEMPVPRWIATMSPAVGAGFYADNFGPLPFSFGAVPPEKYYVLWFR